MQNDEPLVTALRRAATELPASQLHKLADVIAKHEELSALARHEIVNAVPTAVFRDHAAAIYEAWATIGGQRVGATGVALAVHTAADAVQDVRGEVQVSVVWTGPASYEVPIRATSAVLGEVIDEAQKVLIVVSFAAYKVSAIVDALRAAAGRGVDVRLVLESVVESKGNLSFPRFSGRVG